MNILSTIAYVATYFHSRMYRSKFHLFGIQLFQMNCLTSGLSNHIHLYMQFVEGLWEDNILAVYHEHNIHS